MNTTETALQLLETQMKVTRHYMNFANSVIDIINSRAYTPECKLSEIRRMLKNTLNDVEKMDTPVESTIDRIHRERREAFPPKLNAREMHDTECEDRTTQHNEDEYEASQR